MATRHVEVVQERGGRGAVIRQMGEKKIYKRNTGHLDRAQHLLVTPREAVSRQV